MPEAAPARTNAMIAGASGAIPYRNGGQMPQDARQAVYSVHGSADAIPYVSDAPFIEPYNDRRTCGATRTNGKPCKAKAMPGMALCEAHNHQ